MPMLHPSSNYLDSQNSAAPRWGVVSPSPNTCCHKHFLWAFQVWLNVWWQQWSWLRAAVEQPAKPLLQCWVQNKVCGINGLVQSAATKSENVLSYYWALMELFYCGISAAWQWWGSRRLIQVFRKPHASCSRLKSQNCRKAVECVAPCLWKSSLPFYQQKPCLHAQFMYSCTVCTWWHIFTKATKCL